MNESVSPTTLHAIVPGPARDTVLFYHVDATSKDVNALWEHVRFCVSNLVWVTDHFIVTPNPLYLNTDSRLEERFAKVLQALLGFYTAKTLIDELPVTVDGVPAREVL